MKKAIRGLALLLICFLLFGCADNTEDYVVLIGADSEIVNSISEIDLLVIDAEYFSAEDISVLKASGVKQIYSYLNIGSIEDFRSYYVEYEDLTLGDYANWPEEKWVDVSNPRWQEFAYSRAEELAEKGIDGFFIDNIDVYYLYQETAIYNGLLCVLEKLHDLDKKVIINGGDYFVRQYFETYMGEEKLFDGVNQEGVYACYDFETQKYVLTSDEEKEYYTSYLDLVLEHGCKAYVLEYATDAAISREATRYAADHGYICCVSDNIELK